ncbi:hypothetical protein LG276_22220 [Cytobacillus kochii]|uniref:hypothetical protein n=1 Tax=Cytobacillus kochii TaxID=859143 RepID=UPI00385145A5
MNRIISITLAIVFFAFLFGYEPIQLIFEDVFALMYPYLILIGFITLIIILGVFIK